MSNPKTRKTYKKTYKLTKSNITLQLKTWEVNQSMFNDWISPDVCIPLEKKKGCAIDAAKFLKIIPPDLGNYFSKLRSQIQDRGTFYSELYGLLSEYTTAHLIFNEFNIWNNNHFGELHDYLFEKIKENHATLFSFHLSQPQIKRDETVNHTVVLMKVKIDNVVQLIFVEPQLHNYSQYNREHKYHYEPFYDYFAKYDTLVDFSNPDMVYNTEVKLICEYDTSKIDNESIVVEFLNNESLVSFPLTKEQLMTWSPLNEHMKKRYDCYYNVTSLLNIIPRDIADYYSVIANQPEDIACLTQDTASKRFMSIIYDFYIDDYSQKYIFMLKHLEFAEAIIPQMNNYKLLSLDVFTQFLKIHLNHSEGTPIWLRRGENKIGHCVVIAKDNYNNLIIFDPQMNKKYTENEMKHWFERQEFTSVDFLIKLNTGKRFRTRSIQNEMQSQREHSASREPKKLKMSSKTSSKMSLSDNKMSLSDNKMSLSDNKIDSKPKTKINKTKKKTSRTRKTLRKTRRTIIKPDDDEITNVTNKISELKIKSDTSNDIANLTDKISKLKI